MKKILFLLFFIYLSNVYSETVVYFSNNTDLEFNFDVEQHSGPTLDRNDEYYVHSSYIGPFWRDHKIYSVNRNVGITNGVEFVLYGILRPTYDPSQKLQMDLKLRGTPVHSTIWGGCAAVDVYATRQNDGSYSSSNRSRYSTWEDDTAVTHEVYFRLNNGKKYRLYYWFYFTGGDDDVAVVLDEVDYYSPVTTHDASNPNVLNIASYNIWMVGVAGERGWRNEKIDEWMKDFDVVVFNEAFDNGLRSDLKSAMMARGFQHQTNVLNIASDPEDGGVFIASKFPIEYQDAWYYDASRHLTGSDQLASKGIQYVKINKLGKKYHIFGTHADADSEGFGSSVDARQSGFEYMRDFKESLSIPSTEPVIYAGDMNVDKLDTSNAQGQLLTYNYSEYNLMLQKLHAVNPVTKSKLIYTYDEVGNNWNTGSSQEILDYVLYSNEHQIPVTSQQRIFTPKRDDRDEASDLSDHYPVHARFEYTIPDLSRFNASYIVSDNAPYLEIGTSDGQNVELVTNFDSSALWLVDMNNGYYQMKIKKNDNYYYVETPTIANGVNVVLNPTRNINSHNQQFKLILQNDGTYIIKPRAGESQNYVLDVEGASKVKGANILLWSLHNGRNQKWKLIDTGGEIYNNYYRNDADSIVFVDNEYGIVSSSNYEYLDDSHGNQKSSIDKNFTVYPNPTNGIINISLEIGDKASNVSLYSLDGDLVFSKEYLHKESNSLKNIQLGNINDGIYVMKITTTANEVLTKKVILNKRN